MTTRHFCDGCDQEVNDKSYVVAIMTITEVLDALKGIHCEKEALMKSPNYHLCDRCLARLRENANPNQWPRSDRNAA